MTFTSAFTTFHRRRCTQADLLTFLHALTLCRTHTAEDAAADSAAAAAAAASEPPPFVPPAAQKRVASRPAACGCKDDGTLLEKIETQRC